MFKTARSASTPTECKNVIIDALRSSEMHISTKISVLFLTIALLPTGCWAVENVDANDRVVGLVLGVGSILVLIGCWRLERQNDVKDATIDKLQKEIEGLKNHA